MNFSTIEQADGNLATMFGVFTEIGGATTTSNGKIKSLCKVRDDTGVMHNVHIYQGKGQLPSPQQLNQRYQFSLSTYRGYYQEQAYTGYSGFWNSTAQVSQQGASQDQPVQVQPQVAPSRATGATKQTGDRVWEAKDLRMAKMNALNRAVELDTSYQTHKTLGEIEADAEDFVEYIYTPRNQITNNITTSPDNPIGQQPTEPIDQQEVPF